MLDAGLCQGAWAAAAHSDGGGTLGMEPQTAIGRLHDTLLDLGSMIFS